MISYKRLHEVLHYNENSGIFTWIKHCQKRKPGTMAGYIKPTGYVVIGVDGCVYLAHRLAWLYVHGYFPENQIDHINRVRNDNRINNLREVSQQCNNRNCGNLNNNTSGIKGVFLDGGRWRARIVVNKKPISLGTYNHIDNAACARLAAEQCLGWNSCDYLSTAHKHVKEFLKNN